MKRLFPLLLIPILVVACNHRKQVTDTKGEARITATELPERPFILEGDYTPDTGVTYEVLIGGDTCFVTIDSIDDTSLHGNYYLVVPGSDCVELKPFRYDRHWKNKRKEAAVYLYQNPPYTSLDNQLYRRKNFKVLSKKNIEYGQALGYWSSRIIKPNENYAEMLADGLKNSIRRTTQSLTFDIYMPDDSTRLHPLVLMLHGGAFYVGDKKDTAITLWCQHLASLGYVAVSANYRMGFLPTKGEIERTGYMALQDAHAAMRYLVSKAEELQIDTNLIFVGGASAGAITALNLAFMRDKDRPNKVLKRQNELGTIASSGNSIKASFHIKAVANLWGAVYNTNILENSNTDIVSFHGDADQIVPYDKGYPFSDISKVLGKRIFSPMYGSVQIDNQARKLGYRSQLYTFPGEGHSLHHKADGSWNQKNFEFIRDKMSDFFYREIVTHDASITENRNNPRLFSVEPADVTDVAWRVEGGFILKIDDNSIEIVWRDDAPHQSLTATGRYPSGIGFETTKKVK